MPRIGSADHAMRTFVAFHLRDLRVLRGESLPLPNVPGIDRRVRQSGTRSMDHEGREEREGVRKKEARRLIPSFSLVNAY